MISETEWVDRLYDVRCEPDKLIIMITNRRFQLQQAARQTPEPLPLDIILDAHQDNVHEGMPGRKVVSPVKIQGPAPKGYSPKDMQDDRQIKPPKGGSEMLHTPAPKGVEVETDNGGWTLPFAYLVRIQAEMNREYRVGLEEIEAVILASGVEGWISVKEMVPEEGIDVLVWGADDWYGVISMMKNHWLDRCNYTHWMPLPEPPKEEPFESD